MNQLVKSFIKPTDKVLTLNLYRQAFEITGTPEKMFELRSNSKFIRDRLYKGGIVIDSNKLNYNYVLLVWGYGDGRPFKLFTINSIRIFLSNCFFIFSNGVKVSMKSGDFIIYFNDLVLTSNSITQ